jgi:predicted negative regulator of RcsB-dependent stress response
MASPSVARRATRNALESDDVVAMRAAELAAWAQKNVTAILIGVAVLVVVTGIALYYQLYKGQRAERAAAAFLTTQAQLPTDSLQAIRQLHTFASNYDGTSEAAEARILAAHLYLGKGQAAQAVAELRPVADGGTPLRDEARMVLGAALTAAGKRQEAVDTYETLANASKLAYVKQDALTQAAALREQMNDWKGAADLYQQALATADKGSADRTVIEMHLAEAQAHAGAAVIGAPQDAQ